MKKKIILSILGLIVVISIYFGYKGFNLYHYNKVDNKQYHELINSIDLNNSIKITNTKLDDNEYLVYNNIKIKNIFEQFEIADKSIQTKDSIKYILKENDKIIASFWIGTENTYLTYLIYSFNNSKTTQKDILAFLEENNINNDIELFKFIKNYDPKINIFSSVKKMKLQYNIKTLLNTIIPKVESTTMINGKYDGYIFNMSSGIKEINLIKENKRYIFTFIGNEYFENININDLINTIIIDE